jgi:hypothetical protein
MLWFFSKGPVRLQVLTAQDADTGEYLVELEWPDRGREVHRFADRDECATYLSALELELDAEHWVPDGVRLTDPRFRVDSPTS